MSKNEVLQIIRDIPRVILIEDKADLRTTNLIYEFVRRIRETSNDIYEVCIWLEQMEINDGWLKIIQVIDPHSVHIPEEIDALRAMIRKDLKHYAQKITDSSLKILKPGIYP